ncbi:hypothetical protein D9M71_493430 [compost metagenome]
MLGGIGHVGEMTNANAVDEAVPGLGVVTLVARHELANEVGFLHDAVAAFAIEYPVRFVLQVARHQLDQLRLDEVFPALAGENRRDRFGAVQQLPTRQRHQVAQADSRELTAGFKLQAQVFTVYQRAGNHEGLQAVAGFVDELLVTRQGGCLAILEQLHVDR